MNAQILAASSPTRNAAFTTLLVGIALIAPVVAFAGVSVIWPASNVTTGVDTTPLITFSAGTDHATALALGYTNAFTGANNGASYSLTLYGLAGGTVTIDDLVTINKDAAVTSYNLQVGDALTGSLVPTNLKARLWTGSTAPTSDTSAGVCAVLDLKSPAGTETTTACTASAKMQIVYTLPSGVAAQTGSVTLRPSSIVA